jgi:hypothetical protein
LSITGKRARAVIDGGKPVEVTSVEAGAAKETLLIYFYIVFFYIVYITLTTREKAN